LSGKFPKIIFLHNKKTKWGSLILRALILLFSIVIIAFVVIGIYIFKEYRELPGILSQRIEITQDRNNFLSDAIERLKKNINDNDALEERLEQYSQLLHPLRSAKMKDLENSVIMKFSVCGLLEYSNSILEYFAEIADNVSTQNNIFRNYPLIFPFMQNARIVLKRAFSAEEDQLCPFTGAMRTHLGVDLAAELNTPIYAPADGVVSAVRDDIYFGRTLRIRHANNYETFYAHLGLILVRAGQNVSRGTQIGTVGQSGWTTGPHLHFSIIRNGVYVDPLLYNFTLLYGN